MKSLFILPLALAFSATQLAAQAYGNYNASVDTIAVNVSSVGNMSALANFDQPTNIYNGNAASLTATGGSTYTWSPASNYTVTATDANAANSSYNVTLTDQKRQYYNPNTGRYESSPVVQPEKANASLPYDNTVIFDADVMVNIQASSYTAIFSATDFGTTVYASDSTLSARLKIFIEGLKKDSIDDRNIHIDFISMLPVYEVQPENKVFSNIATEKPAGFKIKKNVHVLFYDHRKLDRIITDAAHAGIYDLVKVDYNVNNIESAYDTLRKVAVGVIDMKRQTYERLGFSTAIVSMAEGYDSKYPEERYESYTAYLQGMSAQTVPQQNPNVQIRQAEKEQTIFYNKVPYKQFDKVLNADLAEPGVQFYYKLRVKCKIHHEDETDPQPGRQLSSTTTNAKPAGTYKPQVHTVAQPAHKP